MSSLLYTFSMLIEKISSLINKLKYPNVFVYLIINKINTDFNVITIVSQLGV